MRRLDVRLLGRFEVAVDARRVGASAWEHRRAEDLVKLLALSPGHRLTRDEVVEALWPHLGAKAGVANLHKAAYYARKALGWQEGIVVRHGVVALAPEHRVETDVERLETGGGSEAEVPELLPEDRMRNGRSSTATGSPSCARRRCGARAAGRSCSAPTRRMRRSPAP